MALEFFYRRQKLVIGIMVLLMVAFLIPSAWQGLTRNPSKQVVGYTGKDELTLGQRQAGEADVYLLQRLPMPQDYLLLVRAFFQANPTKGSPGLNWALLVREADRLGVQVLPRQADQMLDSMKPEDRSALITEITAAGFSEAAVRQALVDLLKVKQAFDLASSQAPRPLEQIQRDFRFRAEEIELNLVDFPIDKFSSKVPALGKEELDKELEGLFQQYRQVSPGSGEYGFGYRLGDMVNVAYLVVDHDAIAQAVDPSREDIFNYFMEHRGELKREEPEPTSATSSAPTSASAPAPVKMRTVVIAQLSEAEDQVRQILRNQAADRISEQLLRQAQNDLSRMHGQEDAYAKVNQQLCPPADDLLKTPVTLRGGPQAIKDVVAQLETASSLKIIYPYGTHGLLRNWTVKDDLVVDVPADWSGKSLGEVLGLLAKNHQWPAISWASCPELPRVIFPTSPVDLAPVRIGQTNLVSMSALAEKNPLLRDAYVGSGQAREGLVSLVSKAQPFAAPGVKEGATIKVGEDYPQAMKLEVADKDGVNGRLIWRLLQAQPSQPPEKMTSEIRDKVVADWRALQEYKLAVAAAQDMQAKVQANPLSIGDLASAAGLNVVNTGPFPRQQYVQGYGAYPTPIRLSGFNLNSSAKFIQQAFEALAPSDPQPPYKDVPSKVISLPLEKKVVLAQRTDYLPPLRQQLDDNIDRILVGDTQSMWLQGLLAWVTPANIHARLDYRTATGEKPEENPINPVDPSDMGD